MLKGYGVKCEYCDKEAVDIHHRDKNHANNDPNNLAYLCRSHHRKEHYRGDGETALDRSRDLVDEISSKYRQYRLQAGFALLSEDELDSGL